MSDSPRPELVIDGFPKRRPRWIELATSADHKDVGRILITGALGFLFLAAGRAAADAPQLAIPENTFLSPVAFNRMLSLYGATPIFFFAIPLALGLFHYVTPLQIGAGGPRCRGWASSAPASRSSGRPCSTPATSSPRRRPASTRWRRSPNSPSSPTTESTPGPRRTAWRRWASS